MQPVPRSRVSGPIRNYKTFVPYTETARSGAITITKKAAVQQLTLLRENSMDDYVVPDFKKRQAAGEIFNNPLTKRSYEVKIDPVISTYDLTRVYPNGTIDYNQVFVDSHELHGSFPTLDLKLRSEGEEVYSEALKRAFAEVTANTQNTALWLGESKETVKMIGDIGQGAWALFKKTEDQRRLWARGKLSVPEQQKLTLGILYGILPLEQQIAAYYDNLLNIKQNGRYTARGFSSDEESATKTLVFKKVQNSHIHAVETYSYNMNVRCGVLYNVDTTDFPISAILFDPKQVVSTAYALARLSFVVDWFINVGTTLKAWTPSVGTQVLSSWATVEQTVTRKVSTLAVQGPPRSGYRDKLTVVGGLEEKLVRHVRIPTTRGDVNLFPRVNINLNLDKIFALILLFAKVKK